MALGLASAEAGENEETVAAKGSAYVSEFVSRFTKESGSALCREISQTDFEDDRQLRKYILVRSRICMRLASKAATILADIISRTDHAPDESCRELNRSFSSKGFHCAQSVLVLASQQLDISPALPPHLLIPLDGGIGYSGSTCSALLGGCLLIGALRGGDTSQAGILTTLLRTIVVLIRGNAAFNSPDLSPANDALLRCAELLKWFEGKFGSSCCRELTETDFFDERQVGRFFERDAISQCVSMAEATAAKAAELTR